MSKRGDETYLRDILEAADRIEGYTRGMNYDEFLADTKTQDAVMRNLEIVGEATKKIDDGDEREISGIAVERDGRG
jgi:hypothetical protein